jgi:DNA-binding transcriptional LysR family regulator
VSLFLIISNLNLFVQWIIYMNIIHHINLAAVDLNLLVVFDALMSERHVTRAGQKIGLSQPATSNALSRLRNLFDDELFVRTPEGMQPTSRAIALEPMIQQVLLQIQSALISETPFVPETSERIFTLGMSDYVEFVLLAKLMQVLEVVAPRVKIQVRSTDRQEGLKLLDAEEIDLAIGFFPKCFSWHQEQLLFKEQYVCVSSRNNPKTRDTITLEDYLKASHLLVSPKEDMTGRVDWFLEKQNLKRHVAITVPHFLVAPFVLASTNLIATLAERVARTYADVLDLIVLPLPLEIPGFPVTMLWHTKNNSDPAHIWLRTTISGLSQD